MVSLVMGTGVCILTLENIPATLPLSSSLTAMACAVWFGDDSSRGACSESLAISSERHERVLVPKITRAGDALYSKLSIL